MRLPCWLCPCSRTDCESWRICRVRSGRIRPCSRRSALTQGGCEAIAWRTAFAEYAGSFVPQAWCGDRTRDNSPRIAEAVDSKVSRDTGGNQEQDVVHRLATEWRAENQIGKAGETDEACDDEGNVNDILGDCRHSQIPSGNNRRVRAEPESSVLQSIRSIMAQMPAGISFESGIPRRDSILLRL